MNDRQRYAVGIAAAVLIHLFAAVMLGLFGVKYMDCLLYTSPSPRDTR